MVAIVDDEPTFREAAASLLQSVGYDAKSYASAEEFLQAAVWSATGCLILDVGLPGMSGLELQQHLSAAGRQLPIVFITAEADLDGQKRARALRLGAVAFLSKPFGEGDLLAAVRDAIADRQPRSFLEDPQE